MTRSSGTFQFVLRRALGELVRPMTPMPPLPEAPLEQAAPLPVSVVIPAYNRAQMLERALASVAAQRPRLAAEVIVVDDGSEDQTSEIARQAGVRLIRHGRNLGLSAARNSGVEVASHEWVALLDSDDEWLPHHLATLWPFRDDHVLVAGSALRCSNSAPDRFHGPVSHKVEVCDSPNALVFPANFICVSAAMVRLSAVRTVGGFRPDHPMVEDLDLWIRLLEVGTAALLPIVTVNYHIHEQQMSVQDQHAMQDAHVAASSSRPGSRWFRQEDVERWKATADWDNARVAFRARRYRQAAREVKPVLTQGHRRVGLFGMWLWRLLVRRRGSEVDRDGYPSIAVLDADWAKSALSDIAFGRRLRVRRYRRVADAVGSLARHPAGVAFVGSPWQAGLVRLLRVRPCSSAEEAQELFPSLLPEARGGGDAASSGGSLGMRAPQQPSAGGN